ncbi:unnamed protein product (macronuclear) [Paramecium tetraurelia]|uniref:Uncharacterized protein n=1 Tax=Paramecium tetraurelia TaxID=5888 RepID=A0BCM3_PARTE|nr:uncharacterized protein GSPATT00004384001 [Paramecium tetraurelia]CAK56290.1 unnamed protein product [Paramecium tetraurelia]|eukprot:XP_001423688.1 hypothetical protein (macronuclear) [Paramecium tetraurelia strain d4-2]
MAEYSNSFSKQFREDQEEFLNIAIKKWKFHKNFKRNLIIFSIIGMSNCAIIGIFLLVFAIVFLVFNLQIVEKEVYYGSSCTKNQVNCEIPIEISSDMTAPIFVYYQLENFYRRNRNYFKSKSVEQLKGNVDADLSNCGDYQTNSDMEKDQSYGANTLNKSENAFPCGEIAYTYFTDTFKLKNSQGEIVEIDETDIAWESDRQYNFKNPKGWEKFAWTNIEDEHFMVWMRTAGQGRLKKLWGRIQNDLSKGQYVVAYDEQLYSSDMVKSFFMTTTTVFGQKNMVKF